MSTKNSPEKPIPEPLKWKPITAGTLLLISGIITIAAATIYTTSGTFGIFADMPFIGASANPSGALFAIGAITAIGGLCTLLRIIWWLALVSAIISMLFTIWPVLAIGIISIILIAISTKDFKRSGK